MLFFKFNNAEESTLINFNNICEFNIEVTYNQKIYLKLNYQEQDGSGQALTIGGSYADMNAALADLNAITEMIKAQANTTNGVIEWTRK
ncbi:MAG: hypothetical protein Q4F70_06470 [Clostridia bacterium]|nr:hypothetical protein [Clostridia bacterium]